MWSVFAVNCLQCSVWGRWASFVSHAHTHTTQTHTTDTPHAHLSSGIKNINEQLWLRVAPMIIFTAVDIVNRLCSFHTCILLIFRCQLLMCIEHKTESKAQGFERMNKWGQLLHDRGFSASLLITGSPILENHLQKRAMLNCYQAKLWSAVPAASASTVVKYCQLA